ncbi:MAG: hypothetical protein B7Y51_06215 [Burkholderiales bacterium 28-67-8]|nr:MAG: hypothetical protein B7Y51_06215 [Burkholderiales bacterium 28-67-8]
MKLQLHSIEHAPTNVPYWRTLMEDLCNPPAHRVAKVLGMSRRTIQRYNATGYAPRYACLAVFWLTSWGRSAVHTQAHNDAVMMVSYVAGLRSQVAQLEARITHLVRIGDFGAANEPDKYLASRSTHHDQVR